MIAKVVLYIFDKRAEMTLAEAREMHRQLAQIFRPPPLIERVKRALKGLVR